MSGFRCLSESNEDGVEMHFECDFITFQDSNFNPVPPIVSEGGTVIVTFRGPFAFLLLVAAEYRNSEVPFKAKHLDALKSLLPYSSVFEKQKFEERTWGG